MNSQKRKMIMMALLASSFVFSTAHAASRSAPSWQTVATEQGERLELDKTRIGRMKTGQIAAWTRLTLGFDLPDAVSGNRYTAIEALNTYDCTKREFTTIKRVYLNGKQSLREEVVTTPRALDISAGSVDEKLLGEVCKPRAVGDMKHVADLAAQIMNPVKAATAESKADNKPGVMSADMRTEAGANKKAPVVAVAAEANSASDIAPKQRMIELPKIDKSLVEDPYKDAKPEAKAAAKAKPESKVDNKAEIKTEPKVSAPTAPATPRKAAVEERLPLPLPEPALAPIDRATLERQLATHGPRRIKPKKPPVEAQEEKPHVHWAYEGEGAPANWSKLSPANALCSSGTRQSPIDIRDGIKVDLEPIKFEYKNAMFTVIDNGHTIQVNIGEGNSIKIMGRTYQLVQFHFHKPAEERVNGKVYDMSLHLVHKDDEGRLAVVGILIEKGTEHPVIQKVWNNLPLEQDLEISPADSLDLTRLLPEGRTYATYMGSLTTPPCSENVLWMVLKQPIQLSPEQVAVFARLYKNNARPVQAANGRLIKESR